MMMTDIEELLQQGAAPKPQRPLRADFTNRIIEGIETRPKKLSWIDRLRGVVHMKLVHKPMMVIATVGAVLAIGGTAFALTNWPTISTMISGEKTLKSGNRVVKIEAENCEYTKSLDGSQNNSTAYYEIKKDSKLSNEQVVAMIQGICEEQRMNNLVNKQLRAQHEALKGKRSVLGSRMMKVEAISSKSMTLSYDAKYSHADKQTYAVSPSVQVFAYDTPSQLQNIKVGDAVAVVTSDSRMISRETPGYKEDPSTMRVEAIIELSALTGNPDDFYHKLGSEFVRTEPAKNGDGFTRVYDFSR
ncbi:MAG TPA: hypothetical protein VFZ48_03590 [Candidatus Saccharimonadales bacterium]